MIKAKKGFTLIELLVVISIIGVLSSVVLSSLRSARDKAMAVKFVADFNSIAKAWALWQADTGSNFLNEDIYGLTGHCLSSIGSADEPPLSSSDLYVNKSGLAGWNGPYLSNTMDPLGNEYDYDNDWSISNNEPDFSSLCSHCGVNIDVYWCNGEGGNYLRIATLVDKIIDNGDGNGAGKFTWYGDNLKGAFWLNIAKNYRE